MTIDASTASNNGHALLRAFETILSTVFIPSIRRLEKGWGQLDSPASLHTREDFFNTLDSFVSVLIGGSTKRLSPYSTKKRVCVGCPTQMKSTQKNVHARRENFALAPNATYIPLASCRVKTRKIGITQRQRYQHVGIFCVG